MANLYLIRMNTTKLITLLVLSLFFVSCVDNNNTDQKPPPEKTDTVKTCESEHPGMNECWELPAAYEYSSKEAALRAFEIHLGVAKNSLSATDEKTADSGPCSGTGKHYDVVDKNGNHKGSLASCPCCTDGDKGPEVETKWRYFD